MAFIVMGTSYKTAPISTREKIAVATSELHPSSWTG